MGDRPYIVDRGPLRYLHFERDNVQSVMRRDDPDALCLAYTRRMMSFLLFKPRPRRILLLGLGGGSLAKFCYRHLPAAQITVLEIDPQVVALREAFRIPADNDRFRIVQEDGVGYVARRAPRDDVILVDACDREGLAPALQSPALYANLRRRLVLGGVLVMNVCGTLTDMEGHLTRIRGVFGENIVSFPTAEDGNLIVLAFRAQPRPRSGLELDRDARALETQFGLAFPRYVRKMVKGARI